MFTSPTDCDKCVDKPTVMALWWVAGNGPCCDTELLCNDCAEKERAVFDENRKCVISGYVVVQRIR